MKIIGMAELRNFEGLLELVATEGIAIVPKSSGWRAIPLIDYNLELWVKRRERMSAEPSCDTAADALYAAVDVLRSEGLWRIDYV